MAPDSNAGGRCGAGINSAGILELGVHGDETAAELVALADIDPGGHRTRPG